MRIIEFYHPSTNNFDDFPHPYGTPKFRLIFVKRCVVGLVWIEYYSALAAQESYTGFQKRRKRIKYQSYEDLFKTKYAYFKLLYVWFQEFFTEHTYDTVSAGFGPEPARDGSNYVVNAHSGSTLPEPHEFTTPGNTAWIHMKTDNEAIDRGFKLEVYDSAIKGERCRTMKCNCHT